MQDRLGVDPNGVHDVKHMPADFATAPLRSNRIRGALFLRGHSPWVPSAARALHRAWRRPPAPTLWLQTRGWLRQEFAILHNLKPAKPSAALAPGSDMHRLQQL